MRIWMGILAVLVLGAVAYLVWGSEDTYVHSLPSEQPKEFRKYWSQYLAAHNSVQFLDMLEMRFKNDHPYDQHFAAHLGGEILYEHLGLSGLRSCTDLFGYGCYHGFISTAIASGGESTIQELDGICRQENGQLVIETCQHGIGHGVLEYVGHNNVAAALDLCGRVDDVLPELGCKSGLFMEFFSPMSEDTENLGALAPVYDPEDPLSVCDDLPLDAMRTCLFESHAWWSQNDLSPAEIGSLCAGVADKSTRIFCYMGYGNYIAPQFDFAIEPSVTACDEMVDQNGRAWCRAGVFWQTHFHFGLAETASACTELPVPYDRSCIEAAKFTCALDDSCTRFDELLVDDAV